MPHFSLIDDRNSLRLHCCSGSVRALNGLGYIYFYGQGMEKNLSKAYSYFLRAAETESDGDSMYNAGVCLESGIGTAADLPKAVQFYTIGANKFGHFDCVKSLSSMLLEVTKYTNVDFQA